MRQSLAAFCLGYLLIAGIAASASAEGDSEPLPPHLANSDPWSIWPGTSGWQWSLEPGPFMRSQADAPKGFRQGRYRRGKVSSDVGLEDSVAIGHARRVKIRIRDLLQNDLGRKCEWPCRFNKTNKLDLEALAKNDNIKSIVQKGNFIYVEAEERRQKSAFTYRVFDKGTGASADVRVNIWFGNRAPKAKKDKLKVFANTESEFDVADLLRNDRDRDGDLLDLVRVWCPKDGRVFLREVDGELKVLFQPDKNFTGVTYFKYTIADLSDPEDVLVAGPGAPSPARKTFAEGIVRVRVLASPS